MIRNLCRPVLSSFKTYVCPSVNSKNIVTGPPLCMPRKVNSKVPHRPLVLNRKDVKIIQDLVDDPLTDDKRKWATLRKEMLTRCPRVSEINIDPIILDYLSRNKQFNEAKMYLDFVSIKRSQGADYDNAIIRSIFYLYYRMGNTSKLSREEQNFVRDLYKTIRNMQIYSSPKLLEICAHALSITSHWKESLVLLDDLKKLSSPSKSVYHCVAKSAFDSDECHIGWAVLRDMFRARCQPDQNLYTIFVDTLKKRNNWSQIEEMLNFWMDMNVDVPGMIAKKLQRALKDDTKWCCQGVNIIGGKCSSCGELLKKVELTTGEYKDLLGALKNKSAQSKLFPKMDAAVLNQIFQFLDAHLPFEYVVDATKAVKMVSRFQPKDKVFNRCSALASIVECLRSDNILLLMPRKNMSSCKQLLSLHPNVKIFEMDEHCRRECDLLSMYVALLSGYKTCFVARTLGHQNPMMLNDRKVDNLIHRWLCSRMRSFKNVRGGLELTMANQTLHQTQKGVISWHVPYLENSNCGGRGPNFNYYKWICINNDSLWTKYKISRSNEMEVLLK